ncbi:helix-turn-helix domain-containing protein [Sphingobacterium faecale]|uniref:Helix-turn-helix transcriptional regulator n=1 Tax=Sphingobacterium faecale TaxID=2803775 RepID=A0ABS1R5F0_9SPHI|nr:AraC family transcriptional regulator [Sphingobacterium faecale]MBL1409924.1 helix-turn-helix transcriptional regulator [Sphingobacterium faecale]
MDGHIPKEKLPKLYEQKEDSLSKKLQVFSRQEHINVKETYAKTARTPYSRRDYYKICLTTGLNPGKGLLIYNNEEIPIDGPCLILSNPWVSASVEFSATETGRFSCVFDHHFISGVLLPDLQYASSLFNTAIHPVVTLSLDQQERMLHYFKTIQELVTSDYSFKWDMARTLLQLIIHEAARLQQPQYSSVLKIHDRTVEGFFMLLHKKFPVDLTDQPLKLLTPKYFAEKLHVHVNHLNSVLKKNTGKTTTVIINEQIIREAKTLLRNTNWNISEIAYALGFDYPSHFNKYFKRLTASTPREFRVDR